MSLNEYHQTAHGFLMRSQKQQVPFRKLYHLLYNVNASKNPIRSISTLAKHWPLDMLDGILPDDLEELKARFKRAQDKNKERKLLAQKATT
jgi:hypothetical protein